MNSSGLPPQEAPVMIAEKRKLFFSLFSINCAPNADLSAMQADL